LDAGGGGARRFGKCDRRIERLDLLSRLVEKSLVELEAEGERTDCSRRSDSTRRKSSSKRTTRAGCAPGIFISTCALAERREAKLFGRDQATWLAGSISSAKISRPRTLGAIVPKMRRTGLRLVQAVKQYQGIAAVGARIG
jgi:hypothetical protein